MTDYSNAPGPDAAAQQNSSNGLAIAGLVCGIVGLFVANVILGPLAIIFGGIGLSRANHGAPRRGMAIAAIVLGIVAVVIWVLLIIAVKRSGHSSFYVHY
ncbi:MAG: Conserved rane protein of unknown function [Frankiales bacterium]|jgi:hypothetical protein|nr:Conserved rane protein of unknown function [Frankiales bacterium]